MVIVFSYANSTFPEFSHPPYAFSTLPVSLQQDGKACGVWIDDVLHEADAVIVAVDTRAAIDTLFDQPLTEPWMDEMRRDIAPVNNAFISIGVEADLSGLPESMIFPLQRPFDYFGRMHDSIGFYNYAQFDGYAPKGCTALTSFLGGDAYGEWKATKADGSYEQKKEEIATVVIDRLAEVIPETTGKVAVWDVATPLTYERYCGTWRGSWMSVMGPDCSRQMFPSKPDSIGSLYFAGQRLMLPGGLPTALSTGRQAVQHLCRDAGSVFHTKNQ